MNYKIWIQENWLNFLINFIGVYLILFALLRILFDIQGPDLLHIYTDEQLKNYTNTGLINLQIERRGDFLLLPLLFYSLIINVGIYLLRYKKSSK